jgi:molybdopterin-biosynthesis enzyme MoeA-like protein
MALNAIQEPSEDSQSLAQLEMMALMLENEADIVAGDQIEKISESVMKFEEMEESDITDELKATQK